MLKRYFSILLLIVSSLSLSAQSKINEGIPDKPNPPKLVNNLSKEMPDFLSSQEESQLESKLTDFANQTSNQIVIVIIDDLGGLEPWDFATRLHQKWGVGHEKEGNGVVILIKPTGGTGQRKIHISVGYGLEGVIPDATANEIVDNEIMPDFKNKNYYQGLNKATDVLMSLAKGEYDSNAYSKRNSSGGFPKGLVIPIIFLIIFIIIRSGRNGGSGGMSMGTGFFLGSMFSGGGGGGFGGGGSSGGFGGFGGGGAGGGGAGGSW